MAWWKEEPWRMVQTNLSEIDMQDICAKQYVQDLLNFHATVVLLNAAGISAAYDTKLEFHKINPYLQGDSLKDIVDLCHENGIRVIARTDFSKIKPEIYHSNPQWAFRTEAGDPMEYNGYIQTCINGDYQQSYIFKILEELFHEIPFDGLYCNMGGFQTRDYEFHDYGFCHCENCREKFETFSGQKIPSRKDTEDPVYIQYERFQKITIQNYRKKIKKFLQNISEEICFDDIDYARIEAATEINNRLPHWQYQASSNCRAIIGDGRSGIICSNTSVDYLGFGLRHVSVSENLQTMRLWQNLANLGALDYYLIGRIDKSLDKRSFDAVKRVFAFHEEHEEYYRNLHSLAKVLVRRKDRWVASEEEKGWIHVLTESHIPFAEILPEAMGKTDLSVYDILILADEEYLTAYEGKQIDEYVWKGGIVIASGRNGLTDESVGKRQIPLLKSSGIERISSQNHHMMSSLLCIAQEEKEMFPSYLHTEVIPVGDTYLFTERTEKAHTYLRLIPPQPFGPPELCYSQELLEEPGVIVNSYGKGKHITIPWLPGTFYSKTGHSNTAWLMRDILISHCNVTVISEDLTPMAEVTLSECKDKYLMVQLVNNSGSFGLSFCDPIPIMEINLKIPMESSPAHVASLMENCVTWRWEEQILYLKLDRLKAYDALVVDYK